MQSTACSLDEYQNKAAKFSKANIIGHQEQKKQSEYLEVEFLYEVPSLISINQGTKEICLKGIKVKYFTGQISHLLLAISIWDYKSFFSRGVLNPQELSLSTTWSGTNRDYIYAPQ